MGEYSDFTRSFIIREPRKNSRYVINIILSELIFNYRPLPHILHSNGNKVNFLSFWIRIPTIRNSFLPLIIHRTSVARGVFTENSGTYFKMYEEYQFNGNVYVAVRLIFYSISTRTSPALAQGWCGAAGSHVDEDSELNRASRSVTVASRSHTASRCDFAG